MRQQHNDMVEKLIETRRIHVRNEALFHLIFPEYSSTFLNSSNFSAEHPEIEQIVNRKLFGSRKETAEKKSDIIN